MFALNNGLHPVSFQRNSSITEDVLRSVFERVSKIKERRLDERSKSADATILWERKLSGYRIVDLHMDGFAQALKFILFHFCQTEPLAKAVGLFRDAISMRTYTNIIMSKMNNMMSLCAIQEGTGEFVGVLIASILKKHQRRFKIEMHQGEPLRKMTLLKNHAVSKAMFYETLNAEKSICVDVLCVKPEHQRKGVGTALLRSCVALGAKFASACVGEFTSGGAQTIAERLGFNKLAEIPYRIVGANDTSYKIFEACYPENYSIACMALEITRPEYQPVPSPVPSVTEKPTKKRSKAKKRKLRGK